MFLNEGVEKNSVILMWPLKLFGRSNRLDDKDHIYHITWKYFGETDEDLEPIIEMVESMNLIPLPESLKMIPVVFTPRPEKKVPVLYVSNMPKELFEMKLKLDAQWPDIFPVYKPHVTVDPEIFISFSSGEIDEEDMRIEISDLALFKGGKKIKEFPPMRSVMPSRVDDFGIPTA